MNRNRSTAPYEVGRKSTPHNPTTDSNVADFMSEFARYLLVCGITNPRFTRIMRTAFCRAASIEARFHNKRLNQSAVAAMTGLTRAQVREFAKPKRKLSRAKRDRIENVIEGWATDPAFSTAYLPRRLVFGSKNSSFSVLVRKYGGDLPARSIVRELVRTRYATVRGEFISLTRKARVTQGEARLRYLCQSLASLLRETQQNFNLEYPLLTFNGEVTYPASSAKGRILMQKRSDKSLRAFLSDLAEAGSAVALELPPGAKNRGRKVRTRVVLLSDEIDCDGTSRTIKAARRPSQ